jgi:hypothetical protein
MIFLSGCAKIFSMNQQKSQPTYSERKGSLFSFTLIFSIIVVVMGTGVLSGLGFPGPQPMLVIVGSGIAGFNWLTTPREYQLYQNALVVLYGKPRWTVVDFKNITNLSVLKLPLGSDRLMVELTTGRRLVLQTKDSPAFYDRLMDALNSYRQDHPQVELSDEGPPASENN